MCCTSTEVLFDEIASSETIRAIRYRFFRIALFVEATNIVITSVAIFSGDLDVQFAVQALSKTIAAIPDVARANVIMPVNLT